MQSTKKGFVTIQFLIAFGIIMFFVQAFIGLSLTLTHATLVQYLSYSSARKLSLGGLSRADQHRQAEEQYSTLRQAFFKTQYRSGKREWFEVATDPNLGFDTEYEDSPNRYRLMFYGVSASFTSYVFNFHAPFIMQGSKKDLKTKVASYMGREPSRQECLRFFKQAKKKVCEKYNMSCEGLEVKANNDC